MRFITNLPEYENDLKELLRLFYSQEQMESSEEIPLIELNYKEQEKGFFYKVKLQDEKTSEMEEEFLLNYTSMKELEYKKYKKRYAKSILYHALSVHFNKQLPWGALTGVRPTKLAHELLGQGESLGQIKQTLKKIFFVTPEKAEQVCNVIKNQEGLIKNEKLINLYINLPFCPSRCSYCSFISSEFDKCSKWLPQYIEALLKEIRAMKQMIFDKSLIVNSIYIGGGTPTTLAPMQLEVILNELGYPVNEFTVECGRPDTITKEKLNVLKEFKVTRISINPQTFSDKTLRLIGRKHTVAQVIEAYKLALNYDFDVNMDLIAGLPEESLRIFKKSVDTVLELAPANITIHTLAIKNASLMAQSRDPGDCHSNEVSKMLQYAQKKLEAQDYAPYYMYRLKNMLGYHENVGYTQKGHACKFNIYSMEENGSILAMGAGGISKRVFFEENRIERAANVKDIQEYIQRIDEMIERKLQLFL